MAQYHHKLWNNTNTCFTLLQNHTTVKNHKRKLNIAKTDAYKEFSGSSSDEKIWLPSIVWKLKFCI